MTADLEQADLWAYRSPYEAPADFDAFWRDTLDSAAGHALDRHPVKGWLRVPRHRQGPLPAVVQYHGYASGRGHPLDDLLWPSAGYAHLLMDTRRQGGAWAGGDTPDPVGAGPSYPGFMTRGTTGK